MHYQPAACFKFRLHCHHFNHVLPNPRKVLHGTANRNGLLACGKMAPRPGPELHTLEKEGVSHSSGSLQPCPGSLHPSALYTFGSGPRHRYLRCPKQPRVHFHTPSNQELVWQRTASWCKRTHRAGFFFFATTCRLDISKYDFL